MEALEEGSLFDAPSGKKYIIGYKLGEGGFGAVYSVKLQYFKHF